MKKILTLGSHYVSDFLSSQDNSERQKYSLDLYLDETIGAPRLNEVAPASSMWGKYWYRSGMNQSMTMDLKNIAEQISVLAQDKSISAQELEKFLPKSSQNNLPMLVGNNQTGVGKAEFMNERDIL